METPKTIADHIATPEVISYKTTSGYLPEVRLIRTTNPVDYRIVGIDATGRPHNNLEGIEVPGEATALGQLHTDSHQCHVRERVRKWVIFLPPSDWFLVEQTLAPEVFSIILLSSILSDINNGPMIITGNLFDNSSGGVDAIIKQLNDWHGVDTTAIVRWIQNAVIATEIMWKDSEAIMRKDGILPSFVKNYPGYGRRIDDYITQEYSAEPDVKYFIATWLRGSLAGFIFQRPKYQRFNLIFARMYACESGVDHQIQAATWKLLASGRVHNTCKLATKANALAAEALDLRRQSDCTLAMSVLEKRLAGSVLFPWIIRNLEMIHDDSDEFPRDVLRRELRMTESV